MSSSDSHGTKQRQIFAHRGRHDVAMENTRAAFDKALAYPVDGIETDVQLTRDEVPVLWHDRFLGQLGLPEKHIDDFDYAQLIPLMAEKPGSPRMMRLQDFLCTYRQRCRLLIEIKNRDWEAIARHQLKIKSTFELIGAVLDQRIVVSSFNLDSLVYAHECRPDFPLIFNLEPFHTLADIQHVLETQPFFYGYCLPIEILDQAIVDALRNHHKCIAVYTCNEDEQINKALALNVDIVISDVPQRALKLRDS